MPDDDQVNDDHDEIKESVSPRRRTSLVCEVLYLLSVWIVAIEVTPRRKASVQVPSQSKQIRNVSVFQERLRVRFDDDCKFLHFERLWACVNAFLLKAMRDY